MIEPNDQTLQLILAIADDIAIDQEHQRSTTGLRHVPSPLQFNYVKKLRKRLEPLENDYLLNLYAIVQLGKSTQTVDSMTLFERIKVREHNHFDKAWIIQALISTHQLNEHIRMGLYKLWHNRTN